MKTDRLIYSISCLLAVLLFVSCNTSTNKNILPPAVGQTCELYVIMKDYLWNSPCGDSLRTYLSEPVWGLPAPEPMFALSHHNELVQLIKKGRNILIVNIDSNVQKTKISYTNNVYAENQLIISVDAHSPDSLISDFFSNKALITERFINNDRDVIIRGYQKIVSKTIVDKLKERFNIYIAIPRSFSIAVEEPNFVWIAREEGEKNWYILIWDEPYVSTDQLLTENLLAKMNSMTKKYVPGKIEGSYMATEPLLEPMVKIFEKDDVYSVQINGLWQIENGHMGGPYVNQTIVDANRGRIVTALGFVQYFNRSKLVMLRQLEAILYSMTPTEIVDDLIITN